MRLIQYLHNQKQTVGNVCVCSYQTRNEATAAAGGTAEAATAASTTTK